MIDDFAAHPVEEAEDGVPVQHHLHGVAHVAITDDAADVSDASLGGRIPAREVLIHDLRERRDAEAALTLLYASTAS